MKLNSDELLLEFDSLGNNCEFGLLQRRAKLEPLGLLRFASISIDNLLKGLLSGFTDVDDEKLVNAYISRDSEIMIRHQIYGLAFHTGVRNKLDEMEEVRRREITKLRFLRRVLFARLQSGEKIFVRRGNTEREKIDRVVAAMRSYGPAWLLWVVEADDPRLAGTANVIYEGLIQGRVDRLAPLNQPRDLSFLSWLEMCRSAYALWPYGSPDLKEQLRGDRGDS